MDNTVVEELEDINQILEIWERLSSTPAHNPTSILIRLAELIEEETDDFMITDPDPFDIRHPARMDSNCGLGIILTAIFEKDEFINQLLYEYTREDFWSRQSEYYSCHKHLNTAACRLILAILPGMDTRAVFEAPEIDPLILRFFEWSTTADEPLKTYAIGLLAAAMEVQENADAFRNNNDSLTPIMLKRLSELMEESSGDGNEQAGCSDVSHEKPSPGVGNMPSSSTNMNHCASSSPVTLEDTTQNGEELVLTVNMKQIQTLKYLSAIGPYQEFLGHVFECGALNIIIKYLNAGKADDTRVTFEATRYLSSIFCHKKVAVEFINMGGLPELLKAPRPSFAATGTAFCLYTLSYCEDAMEKICLLPPSNVSEFVEHALWLLEHSHNSGRSHATLFFSMAFSYRVILQQFDEQDGLRKLCNLVTTMPILLEEEEVEEEEEIPLCEDDQTTCRQAIRHFCFALRSYYHTHLYLKAEEIKKLTREKDSKCTNTVPPYKPIKLTSAEVEEYINLLLKHMQVDESWPCVDRLVDLTVVPIILRMILLSTDWIFSGKSETITNALQALAICSLNAHVQVNLTENVLQIELFGKAAMRVLLEASDGQLSVGSEAQKAALQVIINCVCAPIHESNISFLVRDPETNTVKNVTSEELLKIMWWVVRSNGGISILMRLMKCDSPLTDADEIRALACRALAGLSRCDNVRQVVSKLPELNDGSMQILLRDPILQDKRMEHLKFQRYYSELLSNITGELETIVREDMSLPNIYKASVVAQTKVKYKKNELHELIYNQLIKDGLHITARSLIKEAKINNTCERNLETMNSFKTDWAGDRRQHQRRFTCTNTGNMPRSIQSMSLKETESCISLDTIVTEYLARQHALCKNPMAICPEFSLLKEHKCPQPKKNVSTNVVSRFLKRQAGFHISTKMEVRLTHSRFCPVKRFRSKTNGIFTTCQIMPDGASLLATTDMGELYFYPMRVDYEETIYLCQESYIYDMRVNKTGNLILTSCSWNSPRSALWKLDNEFLLTLPLRDEEFVEFGKMDESMIIGTCDSSAHVYDIETGIEVMTFTPKHSNHYIKNRATFNSTDELILTDGILFDVASGKEIYKFDKLNDVISGVFHPNNLEIVCNTEVWDMRNFKLLRTVKQLNQQEVLFSPCWPALYTYSVPKRDERNPVFESTFQTLDARDYSVITAYETQKSIYYLACNYFDTQIAVVENTLEDDHADSSICIYDTGRRRKDKNETGVGDACEESTDSEEENISIENNEEGIDEEQQVLEELVNITDVMVSDDNEQNSNGSESDESDSAD